MSGTIPANQIVDVTPAVISAGGSQLVLNGMFLTNSTRIPIGTVQSFANPTEVSDFFGGSSEEASLAQEYFLGFDGSSVKPGNIYFAQYVAFAAVSAYLQSGDISNTTLAALQAITGTLTIVVDGVPRAIASLDLSAATSFSSAAGLLQTQLNTGDTQEASFTAAIAGTVMTVSAKASGNIGVGQEVVGAGVTANTIITSLGSGTGGTGTYNVSISQTVASEAMTSTGAPVAVTYDSTSGSFLVDSGLTGVGSTAAFATGSAAAALMLTAATGAVISQGAAISSPSAFMTALVKLTQNWATFMTTFDPDNGSGNAQKMLFASWTNGQNNRWAYVAWDTDVTPTQSDDAAGSLGQLLKTANYSGTCPVWNTADLAAFVCGIAASIDFTEEDGRTNFALRSQTGFTPTVTDADVANHLISNGYNFYGAYATANQSFNFLYPGSVSGPFDWMDSYINEIQLNNNLQLAILTFMTVTKSIPYNAAGNSKISAACAGPINEAVNFGTIQSGVVLSPAEIAEVNAEAGMSIDGILATRGWYLQIGVASPEVRAARGSPPGKLWYMDGESVQKINLSSTNVQ